MWAQEIQEGQGSREKEKGEGQGQWAEEEHMPPLQEIPPHEAPSLQAGQMHVEQEIRDTASSQSAMSLK
jgi:hypothetical protein